MAKPGRPHLILVIELFYNEMAGVRKFSTSNYLLVASYVVLPIRGRDVSV